MVAVQFRFNVQKCAERQKFGSDLSNAIIFSLVTHWKLYCVGGVRLALKDVAAGLYSKSDVER